MAEVQRPVRQSLVRLNRDGETIALFRPSHNRADVVWYGPVADGYTAGLVDGRWVLCDPTPAGPNEAAALGPLTGVNINEFLANPDGGDDWIELHNTGSLPVALQGCAIVTSNALARVASPTFIGAGGFVVFRADENPGPDHLDLKLPASAGMIALLAPNGEDLDRITYGSQATDITLGRLPDGTGAFQQLYFSATRGASNYLAELGTRLRISEFRALSPGPDWVEIENVSEPRFARWIFARRGRTRRAASPMAVSPDAQLRRGRTDAGLFRPMPANLCRNRFPCVCRIPQRRRFGADPPRCARPNRRRVEYGLQLANRSVGRANQQWVLSPRPRRPAQQPRRRRSIRAMDCV